MGIRILHALLALPFFAFLIGVAGLALAPAVATFQSMWEWSATFAWPFSLAIQGISIAASFYVYGFSLLTVAPFFNFILLARPRAWRGPAVSIRCLPWYIHNVLTLLVRYTFLELVTPSEFAQTYYRWMGMKIGKGVIINSTAIVDPALIELEDRVTIGGSASILAHYGQGGYLVIAPVKIKKGATIGLRAVIMGGVTIGENAKILANSFVLPHTQIPDGETWGGIPAAALEIQK